MANNQSGFERMLGVRVVGSIGYSPDGGPMSFKVSPPKDIMKEAGIGFGDRVVFSLAAGGILMRKLTDDEFQGLLRAGAERINKAEEGEDVEGSKEANLDTREI